MRAGISSGPHAFVAASVLKRVIINFCFAFDHVNYLYARYLSYQNIHLEKLQQDNNPAIEDLRRRGFGGSLSGSNFSTIYGDLIAEVFNYQTKRQAAYTG